MEQFLELFRRPATLVQAARLRELGLNTVGEFERSLGRLPPNEGVNHRPTAGDVDALTRSDHDLWLERALLAWNRLGPGSALSPSGASLARTYGEDGGQMYEMPTNRQCGFVNTTALLAGNRDQLPTIRPSGLLAE